MRDVPRGKGFRWLISGNDQVWVCLMTWSTERATHNSIGMVDLVSDFWREYYPD